MSKIEDFLFLEEVAEKMGFTNDTVRRWCKKRGLTHYIVGRRIKIEEKDVIDFIKAGKA